VRATRAIQETKKDQRYSKEDNQESQEATAGAHRTTQETKSSEWEAKGSQKIGPRGANSSLEVVVGSRKGRTRAARDAQKENLRSP